MRRFGYFCLCLAGAWILQAHVAQAQTTDLYTISVSEGGNGSYVEYSPPVVAGSNAIASGSLPVLSSTGNAGVSYELPYALNINAVNPHTWLGITLADGVTQSDLISFLTINGGTNGVMTVYSNGADGSGGLAYVTPAVWSSIDSNWDGSTSYFSPQTAYYSTYGDLGGVPGDPAPHPTVEANYYVTAVPEPTSLALLFAFAGTGLVGWLRRRARIGA